MTTDIDSFAVNVPVSKLGIMTGISVCIGGAFKPRAPKEYQHYCCIVNSAIQVFISDCQLKKFVETLSTQFVYFDVEKAIQKQYLILSKSVINIQSLKKILYKAEIEQVHIQCHGMKSAEIDDIFQRYIFPSLATDCRFDFARQYNNADDEDVILLAEVESENFTYIKKFPLFGQKYGTNTYINGMGIKVKQYQTFFHQLKKKYHFKPDFDLKAADIQSTTKKYKILLNKLETNFRNKTRIQITLKNCDYRNPQFMENVNTHLMLARMGFEKNIKQYKHLKFSEIKRRAEKWMALMIKFGQRSTPDALKRSILFLNNLIGFNNGRDYSSFKNCYPKLTQIISTTPIQAFFSLPQQNWEKNMIRFVDLNWKCDMNEDDVDSENANPNINSQKMKKIKKQKKQRKISKKKDLIQNLKKRQ